MGVWIKLLSGLYIIRIVKNAEIIKTILIISAHYYRLKNKYYPNILATSLRYPNESGPILNSKSNMLKFGTKPNLSSNT